MPRNIWDKTRILRKLRQMHRGGADLSYNALSRHMQSLLSAAAYHFGSYRRAIEKAGIDYAEVTRRPRWTKQRIIQLIKKARRKDEDLHWAAVTKRRDDLGRAAFASLQPRLFGKWDRALHAAGLDADDISRYRRWDKESLVFELRSMRSEGEALNSGAIQRQDPGIHAAAIRLFGSYDAALKAARIDPSTVRQRRRWSAAEVLKELKTLSRNGDNVSDSAVRRNHPALYGATIRLFKTLATARQSAGIKWSRGKVKKK